MSPDREISRRDFGRGLVATVAAVSRNNYTIVPIDYQPGRGVQSHLWLPARVRIDRPIDYLWAVDQAEQTILGEWAYSAQRGPSSVLYQTGATDEMNNTPGGESSVGACFPSSVASGNCPIIEGGMDSPAPGWPAMSFVERMLLAVIYHRFSRIEREWGPLTESSYQQIQDIQAEIWAASAKKYLVANTAKARERVGQWYNLIIGFDGDYVLMRDFLEWNQIGTRRQARDYRARYDRLTAVYLADPAKAQPGYEINYEYSINKPVAAVYLKMAQIQYQ